jgi:predicted nucleic acid-binding protein
MEAFFDSSALVPLLIEERHTAKALRAWDAVDNAWAWEWAKVEVEAGLSRRRAAPQSWVQWRSLERQIRWVQAGVGMVDELRLFNRGLGLRAADAGHLLVFERAASAVGPFALVTFDEEMTAAALRLQMSIWVPAEE